LLNLAAYHFRKWKYIPSSYFFRNIIASYFQRNIRTKLWMVY